MTYTRSKAQGIDPKTCLTVTATVLTLFAFMILTSGCATKQVSLRPTTEAKKAFTEVTINPSDYAFFSTGPDASPEALLIIANEYLGRFDSSGWKLRDKGTMMDLLETIKSKASEARKYGFPVTDDQGTVMGKLFTTFRHGKVFIDKEERTFSVATPAMLDIGKGSLKRTSCTISICQ